MSRHGYVIDAGRIDGDRTPYAAVSTQRFEGREPDAVPAPAVKAIVDGCVGAVLWRTVALPRADPQHMYDTKDDMPGDFCFLNEGDAPLVGLQID